MENALRLGDQLYKYLFARHRALAEIVTVVLFAVLLHFTLHFMAGRFDENAKANAVHTEPAIKTTGDASPVVTDPKGPVTIDSNVHK